MKLNASFITLTPFENFTIIIFKIYGHIENFYANAFTLYLFKEKLLYFAKGD